MAHSVNVLPLLLLSYPHQYIVGSNDHESGESNYQRCAHHSSLVSVSQYSEALAQVCIVLHGSHPDSTLHHHSGEHGFLLM